LALRGHRRAAIQEDGSLVIDAEGGQIRWRRPVVLQEGARVAGRFRMAGPNAVGFALGEYDRRKALVIDPTLSYSTYF
jgi:hypothetical protein